MTIGRTNHRLFAASSNLRDRIPTCNCSAYPFPHRAGGGACDVSWSVVTSFRDNQPSQRIELTPICASCGLAAEFKEMDFGIGSYEFWGVVGRHVDIQVVSKCCEASEGENTEVAARRRLKGAA